MRWKHTSSHHYVDFFRDPVTHSCGTDGQCIVVVQMDDIYSKYFPSIKVDEAIKIQGRNSRFSETGLRPFIYLRNLDFSSMFTPHDSSQITLPNMFIKTELKLSFQ
jgi:hypothetical protein